MTYYGLRISEYRACRACTLCLGTETPAPVTGAAADEYNLNGVDCTASVTVARPAVLNLSQWGSGGVPPAAGGKRKMVFRGLPRACWEFLFLRADGLQKFWKSKNISAAS